METTRGLTRRVERLEGHVPAAGCATCGSTKRGLVTIGVERGSPLPSWLDEQGRCRECSWPARFYVGVDVVAV